MKPARRRSQAPAAATAAAQTPVAAGEPGVAAVLHAIRFAAEKHRDDRRKGAVAAPYINHPIAVAEQLAAAGFDRDSELLMAAVLHDVVEDTDATEAELAAVFGPRVAGIVMEVTHDESLQRRERRAQVLRTIGGRSHPARLVKLSDLIANVYDVIHHPPHWSAAQKGEYLDWAEDMLGAVAQTHAGLESRLTGLIAEARRKMGQG